MKPYYQDNFCTIYHGDSSVHRELLESVDLICTDPPYGMDWNTDSRRFTGGEHKLGHGKNHKRVAGDKAPFDPAPWLKWDCILWGSNHFSQRLPVGTTLIWIKRHPELFGSFLSDCEIGWMSGGHGVYAHYKQFPPPVRAIELGGDPCFPKTEHPNQKPISLMAWCLQLKQKAMSVGDPYMGTGTTLVAAKQLGKEAIGFETDESYCEIAARRLQQEYLPL